MRTLTSLLAAPIAMLAASPAIAAESGVNRPTEHHDVTITISPYAFAYPLVEVTGEIRLARRASFAATAGAGGFRGATLWEAGGQLRLYALGDFDRGLHLGVGGLSARYHFASTSATTRSDEATARTAIVVSPFEGHLELPRIRGRNAAMAYAFVGYKYTMPPRGPDRALAGLVLEGGLAIGPEWLYGDATRDAWSSQSWYAIYAPTLYVRAGWSF